MGLWGCGVAKRKKVLGQRKKMVVWKEVLRQRKEMVGRRKERKAYIAEDLWEGHGKRSDVGGGEVSEMACGSQSVPVAAAQLGAWYAQANVPSRI